MSTARTTLWILAGLACLAAAMHAENAAKKLLVGETKVEVLSKYQGEPLAKPEKALIYDFAVPPDVITVDQSPAAKLHRPKGREQGTDRGSPEAVAQQVQASFTKALQDELKEAKEASVPAERAAGGAPAPPHTLLVQGEFTAIHEGNKTKRVLIGFGKGASDVQAHVTVSLTTEQPQPTVLLEFNMKAKSGKKPGAAATVGAGAVTLGAVSAGSAAAGVAAGGVVDRAGTVEADASRIGDGVGKQIANLMKSQTWAAPQPSEAQPPATPPPPPQPPPLGNDRP